MEQPPELRFGGLFAVPGGAQESAARAPRWRPAGLLCRSPTNPDQPSFTPRPVCELYSYCRGNL